MKSRSNDVTAESQRLLPDALYAWAEIQPFVKVGRETWRRYVLAGTAPKPKRIGSRCTRYLGREVLRWIDAPDDYQAPVAEEN